MTEHKHRKLVAVAWPYANGPRHIGHVAGFGVPSDIYARYQRMTGAEVLMISGTDEHGTPILVQAAAEGISPQELADRYNSVIVDDLVNLGLSYDLFTRTTTVNHYQTVQEVFLGLYNNGYMIKVKQLNAIDPKTGNTLPDRFIEGECPLCHAAGARGDQCDACGNQLDPADLINPVSKVDGAVPEFVESEHFALDLPALKAINRQWLEAKESKSDWRPNVIKFSLGLVDDVRPRAMTRDISWGVPIPLPDWEDNPNKKLYVWFDAVVGYLSASIEWSRRFGDGSGAGFARPTLTLAQSQTTDGATRPKWFDFWDADPAREELDAAYFMGKDNITFHSQIWPCELLGYRGEGDRGGSVGSLGKLRLPDEVVSSEFLSMEGQKFSSSKGVVIYVQDFLERYQPDALRYYICAAGPESQDTDFTWADFVQRINSELVANWGNLVNRTLNLIAKNFGSIPSVSRDDLEAVDLALLDEIAGGFKVVGDLINGHQQKMALANLMALASSANKYLADLEPWKMKDETQRERLAQVLWTAAQAIVDLNVMFSAFIPFSARRIASAFGFESDAVVPLPRREEVRDLDDSSRDYPVITGDYDGVWNWAPQKLQNGLAVAKPEPFFVKLDESIIEEELARFEKIQEDKVAQG